MNDDLLSNPAMWPNFQPGDDVSGHQPFAFFAKNSSGKYVNIAKKLGFTDDKIIATPEHPYVKQLRGLAD